jgi:hypothetical protein
VIGSSGSCLRLASLALEALGLMTLIISTTSSSSLYSSDFEAPIKNVSIRSEILARVRTRRGSRGASRSVRRSLSRIYKIMLAMYYILHSCRALHTIWRRNIRQRTLLPGHRRPSARTLIRPGAVCPRKRESRQCRYWRYPTREHLSILVASFCRQTPYDCVNRKVFAALAFVAGTTIEVWVHTAPCAECWVYEVGGLLEFTAHCFRQWL